jgi:hypothetical protein
MNEPDKSKVDELSDRLYSRTRYENPLEERSKVDQVETAPVEENWQSPELSEILMRERQEPNLNPFMKKFFIFSAFFFGATLVIAGLVFFGGVNFVSSKNVDIEVVGPTLASAGQIVELGVSIKNGNNTDLELANFSVTYPQGSRDPEDTSRTLTYEREALGVIEAGDEVVRNVGVVLLGSTGELKEIKLSVEYKVKGSNATFYKDKLYQITIGNSPLTLKVDGPQTVSSGETFTTEISVTLNSSEVLRNVMLRGEYPYGFSITETSPQALAEGNLWNLGDLSPGSTKKITLQGKLIGENQDQRTFRFYIGVAEGNSLSPNFKTVLLSDHQTVDIERPAIGLTTAFNGETLPTYIAPAGQPVSVGIRATNNLPDKLLQPRLEVRLSGAALNRGSIQTDEGGSFNSSSNRITWNLKNVQGLPELAPGEGGTASFRFASAPELSEAGGSPEIGLQITLSGTPVGGGAPISVTETRTVRIASQVSLNARTTYSIGPFLNTGPVPPQALASTTYAIVWSVGNTQSDVNNARVTARLGTNVKWVMSKSFSSEDISYDENTHSVTWNMGELVNGAGFSSPAREVAFQVVLTPSSGQVGLTPTLVSNITFTGSETIGSRTITVSHPSLTTRMPSDPAFIQGDDIVVK